VELLNKLMRARREIRQELNREPKITEIAKRLNIQAERVSEILKMVQEPISLEMTIGEDSDTKLGELIEDSNVQSPADIAAIRSIRSQIDGVLDTLTPRERRILELRFGLFDGGTRTLEQIGGEMSLTRERIRQIERQALLKLRQASTVEELREVLT